MILDDADKKIIKKCAFTFSKTPYIIGEKGGKHNIEPEISIKKDGDTIAGIDVKCTCGKVIHIECN